MLRELDAELRARTEQQKTLDDVVAELARKRQAVSTASFRATAEHVSGLDLDAFFQSQVAPMLQRSAHEGDAFRLARRSETPRDLVRYEVRPRYFHANTGCS